MDSCKLTLLMQAASDAGLANVCREPGCGKTFTTPRDLQRHIILHTGERPFKCTVRLHDPHAWLLGIGNAVHAYAAVNEGRR